MQARRPLGFRLAGIVLTAGALGCQPETAESTGRSEEELVVNPCTTAWVRSVAPANASAFLDVAEQWVNYQDIPGHQPSTGVRYCTPTICGGTADCCRADVEWGSDACFPSTFNGYRRDCSGFVSNVWGLPAPGRITSGLAPYSNDVSTAISWDQLVVGDAINIDNDTVKHVLLFAGWYDTAHTQFCAYEEWACGYPNYLRLKNRSDYAGWNPIRKSGWTPTPPATCSNAGPFSGSGSYGNSGASCLASYNFNVVQGQTYTISTCGSFSGDPYLVVSGACTCRNDDSCGLGSQCTCTATSTGTATICASSYASASASWNYQVTCGSSSPPPSSCSNAGPFSGSGCNGGSGSRCLGSYSFPVQQGSTYTISTCGGYSGDTYLVVSGACACSNDDSCGLGSQCTCTASATGTAYVCASSYSSACASWNYQVTCGSAPPPPPTCVPNRSCVGRECAGCGIPDGCGGTFCCTQTGQEAWGCGNLHPGVCWSDGRCYCACGTYQHAAHEGATCSGTCANTSCTCP